MLRNSTFAKFGTFVSNTHLWHTSPSPMSACAKMEAENCLCNPAMKLRPREGEWLVQEHTASYGQSSEILSPKPVVKSLPIWDLVTPTSVCHCSQGHRGCLSWAVTSPGSSWGLPSLWGPSHTDVQPQLWGKFRQDRKPAAQQPNFNPTPPITKKQEACLLWLQLTASLRLVFDRNTPII